MWALVTAGLVIALAAAVSVAAGRSAWRAASLTAVEARGGAIYRASCASCHGVRGEGQPNWKTPRADGSYPAPPQDASGHTWHHPDDVLRGIIRDGGGAAAPPGYPATMPAFRATLTEEQIDEVLAYIRTMWGDRERSYQRTVGQAQAP